MSELRDRAGHLIATARATGEHLLDEGRRAMAGRRDGGANETSSGSAVQRGRILPADQGPIDILGIDHVEAYVGNAGHTAAWLERLGFTVVARQGPDTGVQDLVSLLLAVGQARVLLSTGLTPSHDATRAVAARGDAVHDVALAVADVEAAFGRSVNHGLEPDHMPVHLRDDEGDLMSLVPLTTSDGVLHSLIARAATHPATDADFAPGFVAVDRPVEVATGVTRMSAVTTVVAPGLLDDVVDQYRTLFGLTEVVRTERDGVLVAVLAAPDAVSETDEGPAISAAATRFVFASPAKRPERNHLDDFLASHAGSGVRTLTMVSDDLDATVQAWRDAGVTFMANDDDEEIATVGTMRRAVTTPMQPRTPLVFAIEEYHDGVPAADEVALSEEALLAAHRQAHMAIAPLGTWGGGR